MLDFTCSTLVLTPDEAVDEGYHLDPLSVTRPRGRRRQGT
jgi:hypothetical protein